MAPKKNYTEEQMQKAIDCVNGGEKISFAAKKYGVPRITLHNKITGKSPLVCSMGPSTYLTKEEEHILETWILQMHDNHIPVTKDDLLDSVQRIISEKGIQTPFVHNRPGIKWYSLFLKRHPLISERTAQNLTAARDNVTEEGIRNWFSEIKAYLTEKNLLTVLEHPERVFNTDESAFYLAPKAGKVLAKKGEKHVYSSSGDDKENLTVLVTGNAAGQLAPTMVVFSYERIPSAVSNNFPSDWAIGRSDSGWMCGSTFYEYIANIFNPWLDENNIEKPVLFFLDGHKSHLTLHLSDFCVTNGIEIIALNPNSTHIMQPMDIAVFRPLKSSWRKAVNNWKLQNMGNTLKKEHFAPVLKTALENLAPDTIKNGFRAGGLCPFGPDYIDMAKIKRSRRQETEDDISKNDFFSYLESEISKVFAPQKLQDFRNLYFTNRDNLEVPEQDLSLYIIWSKNYVASSNPQLIELQTQSTVTVRAPTSQTHTETVGQNKIHPDIQDFSDISIYAKPPQPKLATHIEPELETSKHPSNMTSYAVRTELTTVINHDLSISQNPSAYPMISYCSEPMAQNKSTLNSLSSDASGGNEVSIFNCTTNAKYNSNPGTSRDSLNETVSPLTHTKMNNLNDPKRTTFKNISDLTADPVILEATPKKIVIKGGIVIPSPFKRNLFWPDENECNKKKRKLKEKIPFAIGSHAWRTYHQNKENEKQRKLIEKEKRAEERRDKKKKMEELKNKIIKKKFKKQPGYLPSSPDDTDTEVKYAESDDSLYVEEFDDSLNKTPSSATKGQPESKPKQSRAEASSGSETDDEPLSTCFVKLNSTKINKYKVNSRGISEGCYVVIEYEGEYFPGVVEKVDKNQYKVNAMTFSTGNTYRWPNKPDSIWYEKKAIVEKIQKPVLINKRGYYKVDEMKKFHTFTS